MGVPTCILLMSSISCLTMQDGLRRSAVLTCWRIWGCCLIVSNVAALLLSSHVAVYFALSCCSCRRSVTVTLDLNHLSWLGLDDVCLLNFAIFRTLISLSVMRVGYCTPPHSHGGGKVKINGDGFLR